MESDDGSFFFINCSSWLLNVFWYPVNDPVSE
jgi:hypothetical protein